MEKWTRVGKKNAARLVRPPASSAGPDLSELAVPSNQAIQRLLASDRGTRAALVSHLSKRPSNQAVQRVLAAVQRAETGATIDEEDEKAKEPVVAQRSVDLGEQIRSEQGGGHALPLSTRQALEGGLGASLDGVRVHHDATVDRLSHSVDAVAFTGGRGIFFQTAAYADVQNARGSSQHRISSRETVVQRVNSANYDNVRVNNNGRTDLENVVHGLTAAIRNHLNDLDESSYWQHIQANHHNAAQPVGNQSTFGGVLQATIRGYIDHVLTNYAPTLNNSQLIYNGTGNICNGSHAQGPRTGVRVILNVEDVQDEIPFDDQVGSVQIVNAYPI